MTDKPLDCAGTTGPVGKHDFRAAPRPDIVRPGADSCAPVAPVVDGMPGEIWVAKEATCSGMWSKDPRYIDENYTPLGPFVLADLVKEGAE